MPTEKINGVHIYFELLGKGGDTLVLVHGSWGDHNNWGLVAGELSKTFRVLTYDRRGHSQSERPPGQGTVSEDVKDLIALTEHLGIAPAHIVGNSFGAAIVLKTAAARPDIFKTLIVHEPPLFGILKDNEAAQKALEMVNARVGAVLNLLNKNQCLRQQNYLWRLSAWVRAVGKNYRTPSGIHLSIMPQPGMTKCRTLKVYKLTWTHYQYLRSPHY